MYYTFFKNNKIMIKLQIIFHIFKNNTKKFGDDFLSELKIILIRNRNVL